MAPIRVYIPTTTHSSGRGIGFYTANLILALKKLNTVELVNTNPDLVHYPYFDLFYPTLNPPLLPGIVTIHDVTPLALPRLYPKGIKGRLNLYKQKQALQKINAVLTDSHNSKQDIVNYLNLPESKIHVTPLAADPLYAKPVTPAMLKTIKAKYSLPNRFVLYVGGANPNKNLPRLIKATARLNIPLILVGSEFTKPLPHISSLKAKLGLQSTHPELRDLHFIKHALNFRSGPIALGFVPNKDLSAIYRLATIYCQPSIYEGFGLPVLEAMSAGCLVVSSRASSLPEIYVRQTIAFDPHHFNSMTKALSQALKLKPKEKQKLIDLNLRRAQDFSWDHTARLTAAVYSLVHKSQKKLY